MYYHMKDRAFYLKEHQNHTDVHCILYCTMLFKDNNLNFFSFISRCSCSSLVGCELLSSNKPGPLHYWDAFGGQNMEEFVFDIGKHAIQIKMPWMITWDQLKRVHENLMYENVYHPICIKTLQRYLNMEKNNVLRKGRRAFSTKAVCPCSLAEGSPRSPVSFLPVFLEDVTASLRVKRPRLPLSSISLFPVTSKEEKANSRSNLSDLTLAKPCVRHSPCCLDLPRHAHAEAALAETNTLSLRMFMPGAASLTARVLNEHRPAPFLVRYGTSDFKPNAYLACSRKLKPKIGSHSLMVFATYIVGQAPFPEFSIVLMLDDVQIGYYESTTWSVFNRSLSDSKYHDEEKSDAALIFRAMYRSMKSVVQTMDGFDGQNMEEFTFDMEKNDIQMKMPWMITWNEMQWLSVKLLYGKICHPICIKTLQRYLSMKKNNVMRKVKPRVRLMRKTLPDTQGLQISCLATGFYPRHINLTLFRDGQAVGDDQITGGEILPNGDGTYQMRRSLVISEEELREEHKYNCTMKHLNLDNKLDITFDADKYDPGLSSLSVVFSVLVFMCLAVSLITALIWRKRCAAGRGSETSQSKYSPTPSSTHDEN
ncbi:DLA class I histocompatibility antigen, A9/A9 alpha chain [Labeo rohita]|uniref:DLA class I histocompatibility antigen, A9/A9 alpha chain n=1 Tax=Labeo rohita TaxID=84645 RepID=A0ABQ8MF54_LABRO|nr:DLA class I histocompatibility antigen, A9/A9 alpha chain [Labeo rohita]